MAYSLFLLFIVFLPSLNALCLVQVVLKLNDYGDSKVNLTLSRCLKLPLTCLNRVATSTGPPQRTIQMWRRPAPSSLTRTAARWGWWGQRWRFTRHWSHIGWGDCTDWAWDVYNVQELTAGNQATVCGSKRRIRKTLWNQRKPLLNQVVCILFKYSSWCKCKIVTVIENKTYP